MVIPPTLACRWETNWEHFIQDSVNVRQASEVNKTAYFEIYNQVIAPILITRGSAFNIWANFLSATHPPDGTEIDLHLIGAERGEYDQRYRFESTVVANAADIVYHTLVPVRRLEAPAILLFRGTAGTRATYHDAQNHLHTEPRGFWADTNLGGVSAVAFRYIREDIRRWLQDQGRHQRRVTFIGSSLGGALSMRSVNRHAIDNNWGWQQSEMFIFSSAGIDRGTKRSLKARFTPDQLRTQFYHYWHCEDIVPLTGHFPRMSGKEFCQTRPGSRTLGALSRKARHTRPFISLEEGWHVTSAYMEDSVLGKPRCTKLSQVGRSFTRQMLLGVPATIVSGYDFGAGKAREYWHAVRYRH